jgi:hypothetical protein
VDETACAMRLTGYNVALISQWASPDDTDRCVAWGRETFAAMRPHWGAARYVNYLADDEVGDAEAAAYLRSQRQSAAGHQDQVRPGKLLSREREHPAPVNSLTRR